MSIHVLSGSILFYYFHFIYKNTKFYCKCISIQIMLPTLMTSSNALIGLAIFIVFWQHSIISNADLANVFFFILCAHFDVNNFLGVVHIHCTTQHLDVLSFG